MKPRSVQDHHEHMFELATAAFAEHRIVKNEGPLPDPNRWHIRREGTSMYWVEIVHLFGGRLLVHGDIQEVLWKGGPAGWRESIDWVANSDISYAWEKCGKPAVTCEEVALCELTAMRDEAFWPESRRACSEALIRLRGGDTVAQVQQHLFDHGVDPDFFSDLGRVPDPAFFYAWEAVKTAQRLINALPKPGEAA